MDLKTNHQSRPSFCRAFLTFISFHLFIFLLKNKVLLAQFKKRPSCYCTRMSLLPKKADYSVFYPRMKYPPLAFSSMNWCEIDVFTSNIIILHHKISQTIKTKVNKSTEIYLLMKLLSIINLHSYFSVFHLFFHSYNKNTF